MLHPVDDLAIFLLLNCDMCHADARRGAVPVFFAREKPDHVTRTDLLDRPAPALSPAESSRDDERLAEGMSVPSVRAPGSNVTLAP